MFVLIEFMKYFDIKSGRFIKRVNRFAARVLVDGREQMVHIKNTGRLRELFVPRAEVILEKAVNPLRKTEYSLIGVYKGRQLVNVDSQVPNQVAYEALSAGLVREIGRVDRARREVTYGRSRFDLYYEAEGRPGFVEVKGVTLERDGTALFPDAPTVRGTKHVYEMIEAVRHGYAGYIFFLIQMTGINCFTPNREMDAEFAAALAAAARQGVGILAYDAVVRPEEISLGNQVPVRL